MAEYQNKLAKLLKQAAEDDWLLGGKAPNWVTRRRPGDKPETVNKKLWGQGERIRRGGITNKELAEEMEHTASQEDK